MNQDNQDFKQIKQLLKLKQHEVPPPGYFNNFSSQVISRIRQGEMDRSRSLRDRMESGDSWFRRLFQIFEARPGMVGGFATSLCLLLLLTVIFAEHSEVPPNSLLAVPSQTGPMGNTVASAPASAAAPLVAASTPSAGGIMISTNPEVNVESNPILFGQPSSPSLFQTASFVPVGQQQQ